MKAELILAAFMALMKPAPAELPRIATIAVAAEDVTAEVMAEKRWPSSEDELSAAIAAGIIEESGLLRTVHSGTLRGKAGEICIMQLHPKNTFWKEFEFESLGGTDYASTRRCLLSGAHTLQWGARRCLARHYKTYWRQAMWSAYHLGGACWASPHRFKRAALQVRIASTRWEVTDRHRDLISEARGVRDNKIRDSPKSSPCPCKCPKTD